MAADLHIHVVPVAPVNGVMFRWNKQTKEHEEIPVRGVINEKVIRAFFSNTLGSKWRSDGKEDENERDRAYALINQTPNIWVGEVSWLKAALFEDEKTFIPSPVQIVSDVIGEDLPVIDDALISKIEEGLKTANTTNYETSSDAKIIDFLKQHKGLRCFTVSW